MGVTVMFSCAGVDVARFNRFVAEELKPTYADWGKTGRFKPRVKKTRCLARIWRIFYPRATGWCDSVTPGRLPEHGRPFLKAVRLSR